MDSPDSEGCPLPTLPTVERRTVALAGLAVPFAEVTGSADGRP